MEAVRAAWWFKQSREYPNAGSVLNDLKEKFLYPMMEELDLKRVCIDKYLKILGGFILNYTKLKILLQLFYMLT